jgi:hypothetical protein
VLRGKNPKPPKRADNSPHPFTRTTYYKYEDRIPIVKMRPPQGNIPPAYNTSNEYFYLQNFGDAPVSANWTANDDLKLIGKLQERINGSDFNLGIALAECNQTLQMIGDSAIRINRSLTALKRGNINLAAKYLMDGTGRSQKKKYSSNTSRTLSQSKLSSNWLELQYGWLPLLSDVKAGAEWLANRLEVPFRQRYAASRRVSALRTRNTPWVTYYLGVPNVNPVPSCTCVAEYRKQIIAFITERPSVAVSLGLTDPLSVAWEKIPFSFVADWFIPVGDYLGARGFASSLTGTFVTTVKTQTGSFINGNGNFVVPRYIGERQMTITRTVSTVLDVPMPRFKQFGQAASWSHCANAVALLTQKKW